LEQHARAFGDGHLNFLIVCGAPGVGKSQTIRTVVGNKAFWIAGNATAFGFYRRTYEHRNKPIVLDDADGLRREKSGVRLLKALGQTDPVKSLSWESDAPTLVREGIPRQFETRARSSSSPTTGR
jgi:hypothetical protein